MPNYEKLKELESFVEVYDNLVLAYPEKSRDEIYQFYFELLDLPAIDVINKYEGEADRLIHEIHAEFPICTTELLDVYVRNVNDTSVQISSHSMSEYITSIFIRAAVIISNLLKAAKKLKLYRFTRNIINNNDTKDVGGILEIAAENEESARAFVQELNNHWIFEEWLDHVTISFYSKNNVAAIPYVHHEIPCVQLPSP